MNIYFIRHGKTINNIKGYLNGGISDQHLCEEGLKDFEDNNFIKLIKSLDIDIIYSSPLKRAIETSEKIKDIIGKTIPIIIENDLKEQDYGEMDGMKHEDILKLNPNFSLKTISYIYRDMNKEGENWEQFLNRIRNIFEKIKTEKKGKTILLVSHGGVYRAIYQIVNNLSKDQVFLDTNIKLKNLEIRKII